MASFADLAVILIDATQGVLTQTRRHARICALMGIRYFVFAVNKMDLTDYSEKRFKEIEKQIEDLKKELSLYSVVIIPVSATEGDNITKRSTNMDWYTGPVLLDYLENVDIDEATANEKGFYLPVQRVCRPNHAFRGFEGQIEHGTIHVGDAVRTLPSKEEAHVKSIIVANHKEDSATEGQPVTIQLDREVDVSRGCVIEAGTTLKAADTFETELLWMDDTELTVGKNFLVKLGTKLIPGIVTEIKYKIDINTGEQQSADTLKKNEIAVVTIAVTEPIIASEFADYRTLGELILIDRITNMTSACGVITQLKDGATKRSRYADRTVRSALNWQTGLVVEFRPDEDHISEDVIGEAEFQLVNAGRHTYLYHPKNGEDYVNVVNHLFEAGIIVLLVLDKDAKIDDKLSSDAHYKTWDSIRGQNAEHEVTSDEILERIFKLTNFKL